MFNLLTDAEPKNTSIAVRLAKRWESAKQITRDGYYFDVKADMDIVLVCKPVGGWAYTIGDFCNPNAGCNCPDFKRHGDFCKHTLAYQGRQKLLTEIEAEECEMDVQSYTHWRDAEMLKEEGIRF